jgi:hypothetical protein
MVGKLIRHVTDYVSDYVVSENFHSSPLTIILYRPVDTMDNNAANLGSNNNGPNEPSGGDGGHGRKDDARKAGGKGKGKRCANTAELKEIEQEEVDRRQKELLQRRDEALTHLQADIAASEERIRMEESICARDKERLFMLQSLDVDDPAFEETFEPVMLVIEFNRSDTGDGPVGDENDPVSEEDSEKDPNETRKGASQ